MRRRFQYIGNICGSASSGAIQYLKTTDTQQLIDAKNSYNVDYNSACLYFNGTDNSIDLGINIVGQSSFTYTFKGIIHKPSDWVLLFDSKEGTSSSQGIYLRIETNGLLKVRVTDNDGNYTELSTVTLTFGTYLDFSINWSGLANSDITFVINGVTSNYTMDRDWAGDSGKVIHLMSNTYASGRYTEGEFYNITLINDTNNILIPFTSESGSTVYDVNSNTAYTIAGTVDATSWATKQQDYHYCENYGFTLDSGVKIPASMKSGSFGKAADGSTLTNPNRWYLGDAFKFNGSDNYCVLNTKTYASIINVKLDWVSITNWQWVFSYGTVVERRYGIGINGSGELCLRHGSQVLSTGITPTIGLYYDIYLYMYESVGTVRMNINGTDYNFTVTDVLDSSDNYLTIGAYDEGASNYTNANIYYFSESEGNNSIPFCSNSGSTVYDVNSNTAYTISGTITDASWTHQSDYLYCENYGFNVVGGVKIPASKKTGFSGKDVQGNTMSYPLPKYKINNGATYTYPDNATLKALDTDNKIYDASGNAIQHTIATLPSNWNDKILWNKESDVLASKGLWFEDSQSFDKVKKITKCYIGGGVCKIKNNAIQNLSTTNTTELVDAIGSYNVQFNSAAFDFATDTEIDLGVTGLTITGYLSESGTSPIIDSDKLKVDVAGWVAWVELSNGAKIVFIGGGISTIAYDVNNDKKYTITFGSGSWTTQKEYGYAESEGWGKYLDYDSNGDYLEGGEDFSIDIDFIYRGADEYYLCTALSSSEKGFYLRMYGGVLRFATMDGSTKIAKQFSTVFEEGERLYGSVSFKASDSLITIEINGITETATGVNWTGNSTRKLRYLVYKTKDVQYKSFVLTYDGTQYEPPYSFQQPASQQVDRVEIVAGVSIIIYRGQYTYKFDYVDEPTVNCKYWHFGGVFSSREGELIMYHSVNTGVYSEEYNGNNGWVGGTHGYEDTQNLEITIDGAVIDETIDGSYTFNDSVKVLEVTNLLHFGTSDVSANRTKYVNIDTNGVLTHSNKITFVEDTSVNNIYINQLGVSRKYPYLLSNGVDYDLRTDSFPSTNGIATALYKTEEGSTLNLEENIIQEKGGVWKTIMTQNNTYYKIYFGRINESNITYNSGDVVEGVLTTTYTDSKEFYGNDVIGNWLTNPHVDNCINDGAIYTYPTDATLIALDTDNKIFDGSGNALELTIATLPNNWNNKIIWNKLSTVLAKDGLWFETALTDTGLTALYFCFLQDFTKPEGTEWQKNDDGVFVRDDDGIFIYN